MYKKQTRELFYEGGLCRLRVTNERTASVIIDGYALWLDADGNKLPRRKFTTDETAVVLDLNKPVTLLRLAEIANKFGAVSRVEINDWRYFNPRSGHEIDDNEMRNDYANGEEGGYETRKKDYIYDVKANSLVIWEDGTPIYANDNGIVCRDLEALADTLM